MDNSITPTADSSAPTAQTISPNALETQSIIIQMFCNGMTTKEVAHSLCLTTPQVNNSFNDIRAKACLPLERRAYQACAADVKLNLDRYVQHLANMGLLAESYMAAQIKFKF